MAQFLGHHLVHHIAGDLEGVEARRRHGELVAEQAPDPRLPIVVVRDALSWFVVGEQHAFERFHRELTQPVVVENAGGE